MKKLFLLALAFITVATQAQVHSAKRERFESFEQAALKYRDLKSQEGDQDRTAYGQRVPKELLHLELIPTLGSHEQLLASFEDLRDHLFLDDQMHDFKRRLTWLYPDDGCWARAQVAANYFIEKNIAPKKIFAFGNLHVKTQNAPGGEVYWWYHVATIYAGKGGPFVFDPAIEAKRPLSLDEWGEAMGGESSEITYSLCHPLTFDPDFSCDEETQDGVKNAYIVEAEYMIYEWARLIELGRDPNQELGAHPPWQQN